ncbi:MAG: hypothetical protein CL844_06930 [Crocinitomicaceae bacterium]|nr:hypothetical protein [Crocinitomicaceae bacterium]|tara:strand:- start:20148 stop:21860 length:1713 start_codon:yes stop_codon:yes gene_type:complete
MNNMKNIFTLTFVLCAHFLFAQKEVVLIALGDRSIETPERISSSPKFNDTMVRPLSIKYPLLSLKHQTSTSFEEINPASIKTIDKLTQLYKTYAKIGVGTELMPIAEVFFDSDRSKKYTYGVHVKHLSSFGNIKDYATSTFDRTQTLLCGGIKEKKYNFNGKIHYNNQGLHYYGVSDTLGLIRDSIAQRYSDFGFNTIFKSFKKDSVSLNYKIELSYNNYGSKKPKQKNSQEWRARENFFGLKTSAWYKLNKETYAVDLNMIYNGYRYGNFNDSSPFFGEGIRSDNTVLSLKPNITTTLKESRFRAMIGLDLTFDFHNKTKVYLFPLAELKYSMFNDIFIPYAGVRGGVSQTTFKNLTQENEFLLSNINLKNEKTPIEFFGGIKGTLSKKVSFSTSVRFVNTRDKALYIIDTINTIRNKFKVIYDTINLTSINASISYQENEKLKIDLLGRFNSYSLLNNSYAWNLPRLEFLIKGSYNLFDKFLFQLDVTLEEGRKSLVYESGPNVFEENGQYIQELGFIADLNLSIEYRYNKRISAFLELNNFASQRYQRWYNMPVQAFQFLGGLTFRF